MSAVSEVSAAPLVGELPLDVTVNAVVPLEVFTLRYALAVLRAHGGNKSKAAGALCISRRSIYRLIERAQQLGMAA